MEEPHTILPLAENNATAVQIVGREGDLHAVTRYDFYIMFTHFAGQMRHDHVPAVFKLDTELGVRQSFLHNALDLNRFFFSHDSSKKFTCLFKNSILLLSE